MKESLKCDVGSVAVESIVISGDAADRPAPIGWHEKHAYMKHDTLLAVDGTW
jgi:hypothetical protein